MINILFTICGRAGSKGIENKNIRDFCGHPLPYYSLAAIDMFKEINIDWDIDVVVNSDSLELLRIVEKNPFFEVDTINRSVELSGDAVPKIIVIYNCMSKMQERKNKTYNIVIDLDITSPLRTVDDIKNVVNTHIRTGADVTTSVTDSRRNPYFNMVKKMKHGYKKVLNSNYTSRQQTPEMFDMNASLYAYKPEFLTSGKGVLDGYCECVHMYDTGVLDLDCENDFELMQVIAKYLYKKRPEFGAVQDHIKERM